MRSRRMFILLTLGAGLLSWALLAAALVHHGRSPPPDGAYDAIIVAGCRVDPTGQPSLALQGRTATAVELWRAGRAPLVVFTGGTGDFPPSEAQAAAGFAAGLGLPATAMLLEERSTSTEENARFAAELLRDHGVVAQKVLLVSDDYHTFRAGRVFRAFFASVSTASSRPPPAVELRGSLREVLAVAWYEVSGDL